MDSQALDQKTLSRQVIKVSWPIMLETLLASLFGMVDMVVVGNYTGGAFPSAANVTAIGMTNTPLLFALALIQAMGVGGTTLIARAYGGREYNRLQIILKHVLILGVVMALPMVLFLWHFHQPIMSILGAEQIAIDAGWNYYQLVVIGLFFNGLAVTIGSAIRGVGETKAAMQINLVANATNAILNVFFVNGLWFFPEMGATGAGLTTLISNIIAFVLMMYYVSHRSTILVKWRQKLTIEWQLFKQTLQFGLPAIGEQILLRTGVLLYTRVIAGLGTTVMAAHQIGMNIYNLSMTPGAALGMAASALVGQGLGAGDPDLAEAYGRQATRFAIYAGLTMSVFFFVFRNHLGALYTNDAQVIDWVSTICLLIMINAPMQLPQLTQVGALRGAGDTLYPMIITGGSVILIRVVLAYLFVNVFGWGLPGAWFGMVCDQGIRSVLMTLRFRSGKWKQIEVSE